jgi:tRNA A-37 threonylcarbamoyl transferase component Bud32
LPNGSAVHTDRRALSVQYRVRGGWRHEALVRSGRLIGAGLPSPVVVKTRYGRRSAAARAHHDNESAALRLFADLPSGARTPILVDSWSEVDSDRLHIVMTRVPGSSLRDRHAPALSLPVVLSALAAVADTFTRMHDAGWLVNDVNPGSVLVDTREPGRTQIGMVDFGQASPMSAPTRPGWGEYYPSEVEALAPSAARDVILLAATSKVALRTHGRGRWVAEEARMQSLLVECRSKARPAEWFRTALTDPAPHDLH